MPYKKNPEKEKQRAIERFWAQVVQTQSGCLIWTGYADEDGYGRTGSKLLGAVLVHRVAWLLDGRELDPAKTLDHTCRNRLCVNVEHLEQVTSVENIKRGLAGAFNRNKTRCPRGHVYTLDNLRKRRDGRRTCLICDREQDKMRKRQRRKTGGS
jgi:HNH endonuclease